MLTDPISDFLTRVRNAQCAGHKVVEIPASKIKKEITKILFDQGYIANYKFEDNAVQGNIKIALKYDKKPVSRPLSQFSGRPVRVCVITQVPTNCQGCLTVWVSR